MDILRPDMKSMVWLALGFFVAPKVIAYARSMG
jgi:hypothetical protein